MIPTEYLLLYIHKEYEKYLKSSEPKPTRESFSNEKFDWRKHPILKTLSWKEALHLEGITSITLTYRESQQLYL